MQFAIRDLEIINLNPEYFPNKQTLGLSFKAHKWKLPAGKKLFYRLQTYEGSEHEEDTADDPGLYSRQTLRFGDICSYCIKDVDQNKKDCNQKRHPGKVLFKLSKTF